LQDIGNQNWEYAHRLLQCVAVAARPLRVEELADFLAFDFNTESSPIFREDWRSEDPAYAVRSTCSSLLAIVDVDGSQVIQFAHFSVKEYLVSKRLGETHGTISRFHVSMTPAHTMIASACLGVLIHLDENIAKNDLKNFPLAIYAAEHWITHALFEDVSPNIQNSTRDLFDPSKHHLSIWVWIYDPISPRRRFDRSEYPLQPRASPLHYAAATGIHDVIEFLIISRSQNVDSRCLDNTTALSLASQKGHSKVARVLLEHGADTEFRDEIGWTPLQQASDEGHVEVAQSLLKFGADVEARTDSNNALIFATARGHLPVVRVLLEHGADVNARDAQNKTPLHYAPNAGVSQILLQHGADVNALDDNGRTALYYALEYHGVGVAKFLLQQGAEANLRDCINQSPLHLASQEGDLDLVRWMLQRGADIHAQDAWGQTPFQIASLTGRSDVMQLFLEHHRMQ
jgi:ankyrin repeat protein